MQSVCRVGHTPSQLVLLPGKRCSELVSWTYVPFRKNSSFPTPDTTEFYIDNNIFSLNAEKKSCLSLVSIEYLDFGELLFTPSSTLSSALEDSRVGRIRHLDISPEK